MCHFKTILVPIDFSPGALAAAERARGLATFFDSHMHLLHVVAPPDVPLSAVQPFWGELRAMPQPARAGAFDRLAALAAHQRFDPFTTTCVVRTGQADQVISAYAEEIDADLIVMGVHGDRTQPIGEVVEGVLGRANRAVLAIPAPAMEETELERTPASWRLAG